MKNEEEQTIAMEDSYPFAVTTAHIPDLSLVKVVKKIHFDNLDELREIKEVINLLASLQHPHLINIQRVSIENNSISIFYEYVPVHIEPFLMSIHQGLAQELQNQLISLVDYLNQQYIVFDFDPQDLGVGLDGKAKYFLRGFKIDPQHQSQNVEEVKRQIRNFFEAFVEEARQEGLKRQSVSTEGSHSRMTDFMYSFGPTARPPRVFHSSVLSELRQRVRNTKQRSLSALMRLKQWSISEQ